MNEQLFYTIGDAQLDEVTQEQIEDLTDDQIRTLMRDSVGSDPRTVEVCSLALEGYKTAKRRCVATIQARKRNEGGPIVFSHVR